MWRVVLCLIALIFASCAGSTAVLGRYANRLAPDDIRQIRALVHHGWAAVGPDPSVTIIVKRPDHAMVYSRQELANGGMASEFPVTKRAGRWTRDRTAWHIITI